jgi:hypothetical protein
MIFQNFKNVLLVKVMHYDFTFFGHPKDTYYNSKETGFRFDTTSNCVYSVWWSGFDDSRDTCMAG